MRTSQKLTITACLTGFVVQAIVINYSPLLFLTFENELGISMAKISLLISISCSSTPCVTLRAES